MKEERVGELEKISVEIIQSKLQWEKWWEKPTHLRHERQQKRCHFVSSESQKERKESMDGSEKYLKK